MNGALRALLVIGLAITPLLAYRWLAPPPAPAAPAVTIASVRPAATAAADPMADPVADPAVQGRPRTIDWDALLVPGWDPGTILDRLGVDRLEDGDPRATRALAQLREAMATAPTNPALDGQTVRIAGFVVPLGARRNQLREFLLVPYFGACIHVPPPPANQVLYVRSERPLEGIRTMDTVWVEGVLTREARKTAEGDAGYTLALQRSERFTPSTR